ncbi:MAG: SIMPL domain-containing protein [Patescibacteria group bacterium]
MPTEKQNPQSKSNGNGKTNGTAKHDCCFENSCSLPFIKKHALGEFVRKLLITLFFILFAYVIVWMGTLIRNNVQKFNYIGQADKSERVITIQAEGKVTAVPDIAQTTMGMAAQGSTVEEAQVQNTKIMNQLIAELKALGIGVDDIQTSNYNVYPQYNYTQDEGRALQGYEVSQSVSVKIRDLDKSSAVLALAGKVGANSVSGLQFTIDDADVYIEQARIEALEKVYKKARVLSQALGVRLVSIVAYNEYDASQAYSYKAEAMAMDSGIGGGAPDIEPGSADVRLNVSVTFEIR